MNVLLVNMTLDRVSGGGTVERTFKLFAEFEKIKGVCVRILSIGRIDPADESDQINNLPCIARRWHIPLPKMRVINREVRRSDIVLLMNHWTLINALVFFSARKHGRCVVLCPAGALRIYGRSRLLKKLYQFLIGARMVRESHGIVVISEEESNDVVAAGGERQKLMRIPNGINPESFTLSDETPFRRKLGLRKEPFVLFVGRLNLIKGPDLLLDAYLRVASKHPDLHLVIAGPDGGMKERLVNMAINSVHRNKIHFVGYISGTMKSSAYHGSLLLVVPSRQEAMSIVAVEAAACGKPVIMTKGCGFPELIEANGGIEVSPDADAIATEINRLLENAKLKETMGESARRLVMEKFTWANAAQMHMKLFMRLLEEKH